MAYFVPEVLQSSGMDCGPAALTSLLQGLGFIVNYDRIRDACNTGADGTSIDSLQDLLDDFGLQARQEIAPISDAFDVLALRVPCIVITTTGAGSPHFILVWKIIGSYAQVMDPAGGRRHVHRDSLSRDFYVHTQSFPAAKFVKWWSSTGWKAVTDRRLAKFGRQGLLTTASPEVVTRAEAAARLVTRLETRKALASSQVAPVFDGLLAAQSDAFLDDAPLRHSPQEATISMRGMVLLTVKPPKSPTQTRGRSEMTSKVRQETKVSAMATFWSLVTGRARRIAIWLVVVSTASVGVSVIEMLFLRAAFNARSALTLPIQQAAGFFTYFAIVGILLALDATLAFGVLRLGRILELRLRIAILEKLPRLPDKYFRTRPLSDITFRSLGLFDVKAMPSVVLSAAKHLVDVLVTFAALCILHPGGIPILFLTLIVAVTNGQIALRISQSIENRILNHSSSLGQVFLDALMGLVPLRAHGGQLALRARQDEFLAAWQTEANRGARVQAAVDSLQELILVVLVTYLLLDFIRDSSHQQNLLLLCFWALRLPIHARAFSISLHRIPGLRASIGRLLEPLTAEESTAYGEMGTDRSRLMTSQGGISLKLSGVTALMGKQKVLDNVSLSISSGERVAVIGSSGAGKSSLVSVVLGLIDMTSGSVLIDGIPLTEYDIPRLRRQSIWVDPMIQIWNRSLAENLQFGNAAPEMHPIQYGISVMDLDGLIGRFPEGISTPLGESGSRVSGGEGQRVRAARAMIRRGSRLVFLDEAFRGLERPVRRRLSAMIREKLPLATLIEVTHDVSDVASFDKVLIIENGRLVEAGSPAELAAKPNSRYLELVRADRDVQSNVWLADEWRRLTVLGDGTVTEALAARKAEAGPDRDRPLQRLDDATVVKQGLDRRPR